MAKLGLHTIETIKIWKELGWKVHKDLYLDSFLDLSFERIKEIYLLLDFDLVLRWRYLDLSLGLDLRIWFRCLFYKDLFSSLVLDLDLDFRFVNSNCFF